MTVNDRQEPVEAVGDRPEREGLAERLRTATDGVTELQDRRGSVIGYDCHIGNIGDLCDEAADRIETLEACLGCDDESVRTAWAREAELRAGMKQWVKARLAVLTLTDQLSSDAFHSAWRELGEAEWALAALSERAR